jgi:hypothetical protein
MTTFRKDASKDGEVNADADRVAQAAAVAVSAAMAKPHVNQALIDAERAKQRKPKDDTKAFKVHARGLKRKRRCGIEFTGDPQIVNAEDLTEEQAIELLNTPHLFVEELGSTSKEAVKPHAAAVAGPAADQLRAPGDAPVPTPGDSPGGRAPGPHSIGGMMAVVEPTAQAKTQAHESPKPRESK